MLGILIANLVIFTLLTFSQILAWNEIKGSTANKVIMLALFMALSLVNIWGIIDIT